MMTVASVEGVGLADARQTEEEAREQFERATEEHRRVQAEADAMMARAAAMRAVSDQRVRQYQEVWQEAWRVFAEVAHQCGG